MRMVQATLFVSAVLTLAVGTEGAAPWRDALETWDEFNARRYVILNCHPSQTASDSDYLSKAEDVERAAADLQKALLDKADPSNRAENAKRAAGMMDYRRRLREFSISEQIRNYGCDWLDDQFKFENP